MRLRKVTQEELDSMLLRHGNKSEKIDAANLDFSQLDFHGEWLGDARFAHCVFDWCVFDTGSAVEFNDARFYNCSFRHAHMSNCDLTDAELIGVNFEYADLTNATFYNTLLQNVNFRKAKMEGVRASISQKNTGLL